MKLKTVIIRINMIINRLSFLDNLIKKRQENARALNKTNILFPVRITELNVINKIMYLKIDFFAEMAYKS